MHQFNPFHLSLHVKYQANARTCSQKQQSLACFRPMLSLSQRRDSDNDLAFSAITPRQKGCAGPCFYLEGLLPSQDSTRQGGKQDTIKRAINKTFLEFQRVYRIAKPNTSRKGKRRREASTSPHRSEGSAPRTLS